MSETDWSVLGPSGLPTGTVTLLLADVEGSTRLWEAQSGEMTAAVARLDRVLAEVVAGDLESARNWTDEALVVATGYHRAWALMTQARVAAAAGEREEAERDARDALTGALIAARTCCSPTFLKSSPILPAVRTTTGGGHRSSGRGGDRIRAAWAR